MWAEVIFCNYFYLHNSRVLTYYVIAIVRFMAKHKSVLRQNTFKTTFEKCFTVTESFLQNTFVFLICGACLLNKLTEGHLFPQKGDRLLQHQRLQENMESRQNLFFSMPSVVLPPFPPVKW